MRHGKLFNEFINRNPWPVTLTEAAHQALDDLLEAEGREQVGDEGKSLKVVIDLFERAFGLLGYFPPDDKFFTDPRPSVQDMSIWLVVALPGKNIMVKAQYRLQDHQCVVTELWVK